LSGFHRDGDAIPENAHPLRRKTPIYRLNHLFAAPARHACFVQGMNGTATLDRPQSRRSTLWKSILIGIPIVTLGILIWLRQIEVNALRERTVSSYGTVPEFTLINQEGKNFGSADLRGKIWIADFVYTTCPGPCPMISNRMSEIQEPLKNTDVHLVSFSVDPEKDTPKVLQGYAEKLGAEMGRWDFLTGPKSTIYNL